MKQVLGALLAGLIVGTVGMAIVGKRQYDSLKSFADSTAVASAKAGTQAHKFSDSLTAVVDSLKIVKRKIVTKVIEDTIQVAAAESALAHDVTAQDSIASLTAALRASTEATHTLWRALAISDSLTGFETQRADSLEHTVDALNASIQTMTAKINALHGTPGWIKLGFEALKIGGAFAAGVAVASH